MTKKELIEALCDFPDDTPVLSANSASYDSIFSVKRGYVDYCDFDFFLEGEKDVDEDCDVVIILWGEEGQ